MPWGLRNLRRQSRLGHIGCIGDVLRDISLSCAYTWCQRRQGEKDQQRGCIKNVLAGQTTCSDMIDTWLPPGRLHAIRGSKGTQTRDGLNIRST
jgi:hypothetical protein